MFHRVIVASPTLAMDEHLSALIRMAEEEAAEAPSVDRGTALPVPAVWQVVARTALPVRGPSLPV